MATSQHPQFALALEIDAPPRLADFIPGANAEMLDQLLGALGSLGAAGGLGGGHATGQSRATQAGWSPGLRFPAFHLWGGAGVGKTFLCRAVQHQFAHTQAEAALEIHDNIDAIPAEEQAALLGGFQRLNDSAQGLWLSTSRAPPVQLELLADLKSRLSWGLVFEVKALSDDALLDALEHWARRRALPLGPEVLPWLLRHSERSLPHLTALLRQFDRYALERQRSLSLPLLREMLQLRP